VDAHTHLLFAGSREGELVLRQRGAGYLEILAAGGGILSTVAATREASTEALEEHGRRWLGEMLAHGTTTVEAKSGYGWTPQTGSGFGRRRRQLGWGLVGINRHVIGAAPGVAAQVERARRRLLRGASSRGPVSGPRGGRRLLLPRLHADEIARRAARVAEMAP
jgi:imidazolonepropionase-like amidohydrolase